MKSEESFIMGYWKKTKGTHLQDKNLMRDMQLRDIRNLLTMMYFPDSADRKFIGGVIAEKRKERGTQASP